MKHILSVVAFAAAAMALAGPYERCGGKGWYGATNCVAGFTCTVSNEWYSQCVAVPFNSNNTNIAGPYGQCGGKAWNGTTICTDGYSCKYVNDWYSQCVLNWALPTGSAPATVVTMTTVMTSSIIKAGEHQPTTSCQTPTTTPSVATTTATSAAPTPTTPAPGHGSGKLEWVGVDESAAEFGPGQFPGVAGTDYTFPDEDNINGLIKEGYNIFRIPFAMERMVAPSVSSPLQKDYLNSIKKVIESITRQGKHAILDPHNHGRYKGNVITDTDAFKSFWTKLAGEFRDNELVIFDTNNEYFDMESSLVLKLNQAAIDGIRGAGAKTQYIMVEGNSYSGAWTWPTANDNLKALVDPSNKIIYEMHQYLDQDGGGTSADCVSSTIGVQRITAATKWLRDNKKTGVLGEFAAGANKQCKDAIKGMLDHIAANSDVWKGVLWWGGGPWWHNYIYSFEAPSGDGYKYYNDLLKSYVDA